VTIIKRITCITFCTLTLASNQQRLSCVLLTCIQPYMKPLFRGRVDPSSKQIPMRGMNISRTVLVQKSLGVSSSWRLHCIITHHLQRQTPTNAESITPTNGVALKLTRKVDGVGHTLFMDNYFSSYKLFYNVRKKKINSCTIIDFLFSLHATLFSEIYKCL
jgi:hypothetical protein